MSSYDEDKREFADEVSNSQNDIESGDGIDGEDMNENNTNTDAVEENVYTVSEKGYSINGSLGTEYGVPPSDDGFIYTNDIRGEDEPLSDIAVHKSSIPMALKIALVAVTLVLMSGCFFWGGMIAFQRAQEGTEDSTDGDDTENRGNLYIEGESETDGNSSSPNNNETVEEATSADSHYIPAVTDSANNVGTSTGQSGEMNIRDDGDVTFPEDASIVKSEPLREDGNGDGKADVETGADGEVLTSAGSSSHSIATVVNMIADSVVEISTETVTNSSWVGQYVQSGAGSGVIISKEGYVVTNNHVIDGADNITVRLTDSTEYAAYLVGTDPDTDIAVLWIDPDGRELSVAPLGSSFDLVVGEDIIAIGNPLGELGGTVTEGIISATARDIAIDGKLMTLLQISSPINPGNSGGGLFNRAGQLVGVVNAKCSSDDVEGLGFAIPIDTAYEIICELIEYRYVKGKPSSGLTVMEVSSYQAMQYFNSRYSGVYIYESDYSDELHRGDLIVSVDGEQIATSNQLADIINKKSVGDTVQILVWRNSAGKEVLVTLTIGEYVPSYLTAKEANNAA